MTQLNSSQVSYLVRSGLNVVSAGAGKLATLATAVVAFTLLPPSGEAGTVEVDFYSTYDPANDPSGTPYSGYAGHLELSSDLFVGAGYDFGNPFGLSSFAAVIRFTEYMSTTGFYSGGLNSGNDPVLWMKGGTYDPFWGGLWAAGAAYGEILFDAGYNDFELVFLAGEEFGGGFGEAPYNLILSYFKPWEADPRMADGAYAYVTTKVAYEPVPDSLATLGILAATLAAAVALRRQLA